MAARFLCLWLLHASFALFGQFIRSTMTPYVLPAFPPSTSVQWSPIGGFDMPTPSSGPLLSLSPLILEPTSLRNGLVHSPSVGERRPLSGLIRPADAHEPRCASIRIGRLTITSAESDGPFFFCWLPLSSQRELNFSSFLHSCFIISQLSFFLDQHFICSFSASLFSCICPPRA